jgi:fermentation-respiration switch protein FrsA (DUF1100 family)
MSLQATGQAGTARVCPPEVMSAALIVLILAAQGVGDALVGGGLATADAVGVDLEQDGDAVLGAAGDLGGGNSRVQGQGHVGAPKFVGPPGLRGVVLGGVSASAWASAQTRCRRCLG